MKDNSESVGGGLFETLVGCGKESYSSQVCGGRDGGGNGRGSFAVKVRTDATKLTNVIIAGFRER